MRSHYMRIKLYKSNADLTVQRINYVRMNSSLKDLTVKFFVTICISCVLFQIVDSKTVEKGINFQVGIEKREAVDVQVNAKSLESKNDNKTVQVRQEKNTNNFEHEKRNDETFFLEEERLRIRREKSKNIRSQKGTKKQKRHRRNKRRGTNGVLVAKFYGAIPEMQIENDDLIGPWMKSINEINNPFEFTNFHLVEEKKAIEINKSGLYTISVQIGYTGNSAPNSYKLMLSSEGDSVARKIAMCITNSTGSTCPTSTTKYIKKKDRIRIQQQEKNRSINLRPGFSFIDLIFYG